MEVKDYKYVGNHGVKIVESILNELTILGNVLYRKRYYDDKIYVVIVGEYYFLRNNSMATFTVDFMIHTNFVEATAFSTGAGAGLFNFSLGATSKLMKKLNGVLEMYEFIETKE